MGFKKNLSRMLNDRKETVMASLSELSLQLPEWSKDNREMFQAR
jgi:hypothetical protein